MFNDETLHTWFQPYALRIDVKQTEMASEWEREKSKLKAIHQNKVVIKIIASSAICRKGRERKRWGERGRCMNECERKIAWCVKVDFGIIYSNHSLCVLHLFPTRRGFEGKIE